MSESKISGIPSGDSGIGSQEIELSQSSDNNGASPTSGAPILPPAPLSRSGTPLGSTRKKSASSQFNPLSVVSSAKSVRSLPIEPMLPMPNSIAKSERGISPGPGTYYGQVIPANLQVYLNHPDITHSSNCSTPSRVKSAGGNTIENSDESTPLPKVESDSVVSSGNSTTRTTTALSTVLGVNVSNVTLTHHQDESSSSSEDDSEEDDDDDDEEDDDASKVGDSVLPPDTNETSSKMLSLIDDGPGLILPTAMPEDEGKS